MKRRVLLLIMYICSFISSVAPIIIYFGVNHEKYIKAPNDAFKLCLGGIICVALVLLKILGRLKLPSSTVTFGFIFLLSYLLKSITDDLIIFSFLALLGDFIDKVCFMIPINKIKERIMLDKGASAAAEKVEEIMERYFRGGV